jgi:branched-chain amino acid transport system permease protein
MKENQLSVADIPAPAASKGKWITPTVYAGVIVILALLPLAMKSAYMLHILILAFIFSIAAVSLRLVTISGQFPLAHGAFMGIGAYIAGMASRWLGWSPWATIPLGAAGAMAIGIFTGFPFARLRALYYAMGSMFFGIGVTYLINAGGTWTGGYAGLTKVTPLFVGSKIPYYYFFLGLAVVCIFAMWRFEYSRIGTNMKAIAQSHLVASSVGINEAGYRILAVAIGIFFVGLAGATYSHYNTVISPTSFNFMATLWIVMYVLIGGIESFPGPIVGAFVLVLIPEFFRNLKQYSPYISAGILLIVVYLIPEGLINIPARIGSLFGDKNKGKKRIVHAVGD